MWKSFAIVKPRYKVLTARGLGCAAEDGNSMDSSGPSASLSSLEIRPWTRGDGARRLPSSCRCFSSSGMLSDPGVDRLTKNTFTLLILNTLYTFSPIIPFSLCPSRNTSFSNPDVLFWIFKFLLFCPVVEQEFDYYSFFLYSIEN